VAEATLSPQPTTTVADADGTRWDEFTDALRRCRRIEDKGALDQSSWQGHLLNLIGARQGQADTVHAIDVLRLKSAVEETIITWEFGATLPNPAGVIDFASFRTMYSEADVDRAYGIASELPPSFDRCALLLRCARDIGTLSAARVALESLDTLLDVDRVRLDQHIVLSRIRDGLSSLSTAAVAITDQRNVAEDIPSTWPTWLRRLTAQDPWRAAVPAAEIAAREWSVTSFLQDPSTVQETADLLLGDRPPWGQVTLRDALPYFLEFCVAAGADPRLKPVYESLFLTIAIDGQVSLPQVAALLRVIDMRLQLGVEHGDYIEMLTQLMSAIQAVESPSVADTALEAIEILISLPCPDTRERQQFVLRAATLLQRWYRRIDAAQFALVRTYAEELGLAAGSAIRRRPSSRRTRRNSCVFIRAVMDMTIEKKRSA
jgi:hypothetical protein